MNRRLARWMFFVPFVLVVALAVSLDQHRESATCSQLQQNRDVLREVVTIATEDGGSLDLTAVPGFADLDAETQVFFENLAAASASNGDRERLRIRLLASIPDTDC